MREMPLRLAVESRDYWKEEAERYSQNSDFWRAKAERRTQEAERRTQERDEAYREIGPAFAEIERLRGLLHEVCPNGIRRVDANLDARIREALKEQSHE